MEKIVSYFWELILAIVQQQELMYDVVLWLLAKQ